MTYKLPPGLRSRFNASTYENRTTWKDIYGNHDAVNEEAGASMKIPKDRFWETEGGIPASKGFAYVQGDEDSRWVLTEKFTNENWTVVYITRYDPTDLGPCYIWKNHGVQDYDTPCRDTILSVRGSQSYFGHKSARVGISQHKASSQNCPDNQCILDNDTSDGTPSKAWGIGNNEQWLFAIEQPKRSIVRGGINQTWVDKRGGDDIEDVQVTINATDSRPSRWNLADFMYWPRVLNPNEINMVKTYLDQYAEGNIDVFQETPTPGIPDGGIDGGGDIGSGNGGGGGDNGSDGNGGGSDGNGGGSGGGDKNEIYLPSWVIDITPDGTPPWLVAAGMACLVIGICYHFFFKRKAPPGHPYSMYPGFSPFMSPRRF